MSILAIACYKPKPGQDDNLLKLISSHFSILRSNDLVTKNYYSLSKADDGTFIEIFEWNSSKAKQDAHEKNDIIEIWHQFEKISKNVSLSMVPESKNTFANFTPISSNYVE